MNSLVALKCRATVLSTPGNNPGLLIVDGHQWPFTLEAVWKSPVAPAVNMPVDVEFDDQGYITVITAVGSKQITEEGLSAASDAAKQYAGNTVHLARKGLGEIMARAGKPTLVGTGVLCLAFFTMPFISVSRDVVIQTFSKSFTFWDAIGLSAGDNMNVSNHGFFSLLALAGMLAPLAAPFVRHRAAKYIYAVPLACLCLGTFEIWQEFGKLADTLNGMGADPKMLQYSFSYGALVMAMTALVVAAKALKPQSTQDPKFVMS